MAEAGLKVWAQENMDATDAEMEKMRKYFVELNEQFEEAIFGDEAWWKVPNEPI
tara:strand:+ start:118 stop:279 length:162 start_codon:yes stop_codon:yes gene_type:complete